MQHGTVSISPTLNEMADRLRQRLARCSTPAVEDERHDETELSERERQVLRELLVGQSEKEVAMHLKISTHTAHEHVKAIYKSLGVSSRAELMARFLRIALSER